MHTKLLDDVLKIAGEVFRRPVTAADGFFDLGGDSITAVEFAIRLEERFGIEPDIDVVFSADTMTAIAGAISDVLHRHAS